VRASAFISGGRSSNAYLNQKDLIVKTNANVPISSSFLNKGKVTLESGAVLGLSNCENLDDSGVLSGGEWVIADDAQVILPRTFTRLSEKVSWKGPNAKNVRDIDKGSRLTKTTDEIHSVRLEVQGVVSSGGGTRTTIPETELQNGDRLEGEGTHVGDVQVGTGVIAPGSSPGELSIEGDLNFTVASLYEWEAASPTEADMITVAPGSASLSGIFRPSLLGDYVPALGQSFTILTAPAISGTFDFIDLSFLPPGLDIDLTYDASSVTLTFTAADLSDFTSWQATRFTPEEQLDITISGPDADPDGDDIPNKVEFAHGLNPKWREPYPLEVVGGTGTTMDLRFPWAAGDHATFIVRTSESANNFQPATFSVMETISDIKPGIGQITIRTSHPQSRAQFGTLSIELSP